MEIVKKYLTSIIVSKVTFYTRKIKRIFSKLFLKGIAHNCPLLELCPHRH